MTSTKKIIIKIFILVLLALSPIVAMAVDASLPDIKNPFDNLQVKIPGMERFSEAEIVNNDDEINIYFNWIGEYLIGIYNYAIAVVGVFAVVAMAIGGVIWIMSFGNPSLVSVGKDWVVSSLLGLALALGSYIILHTINEDFVNFKPLGLTYIESEGEVNPYTTDAYSGVLSQGESCYLNTFGSSNAVVSSRIVIVNCPALGGNIEVHELAAESFRQACAKIPLGLKTICGTPVAASKYHNWRPNANNPSVLSLHSFGIAWDINGFGCGPGGRKGCDNKHRMSNGQCPCKVIFPDWVTQAFKSVPGFRWGGDYKGRCDNMHFEWLGPCQKK